MTFDTIVMLSLVLAFMYFLSWIMRSDIRKQIERPKYRFQDQVRNFDSRFNNGDSPEGKEHAGQEPGI